MTDASGNLYAAGNFNKSGVYPYGERYVAKWNGSAWSELGSAFPIYFNSDIYSMTTDVSGNIYVAGVFFNNSGKQYVAKRNGSVWSELGGANTSTFNNGIGSLTIDSSGNLYAAGWFTNDSGWRYVAKWNGSKWSELGGANASNFNGPIKSLTTDSSGNLYAAGNFSNNIGNGYVAKWNGSVWSELGGKNTSTFNGVIWTMTIDANGNLYSAGGFILPNVPYTNYYVAKYTNPTTTPLTLTSFTAQATPPSPEGQQIALKWQTATEVNTSHFIVEQSSDGKTFTAKGTVKAVGSGANSYAFDVPLFLNTPSGDGGGLGVRFFRLKIIDKDGSFTYSKIVSVSIPTTYHLQPITLSPNPAKEFTTVSIHLSKPQTIQYQLINAEGKQLSVQKQSLPAGNNSFPINLKGLAKGIYWLKIEGIGEKQLVVE